MVFGFTLFEFGDSIKEGDGEQLHDLCKVTLLIYKASERTKYSYGIILQSVKLAGMLSQYEAHNLKHNQLFNKHGFIEGNVPLDLRMEKMYDC